MRFGKKQAVYILTSETQCLAHTQDLRFRLDGAISFQTEQLLDKIGQATVSSAVQRCVSGSILLIYTRSMAD